MNNNGATISCNDGIMSFTRCFYAVTDKQKDVIMNLCGLQFGSITFPTLVYTILHVGLKLGLSPILSLGLRSFSKIYQRIFEASMLLCHFFDQTCDIF